MTPSPKHAASAALFMLCLRNPKAKEQTTMYIYRIYEAMISVIVNRGGMHLSCKSHKCADYYVGKGTVNTKLN